MISKNCLRSICSILQTENEICLYDCKNQKVFSIDNEKIEYLHSGIIQTFSSNAIDTIRYASTVNKSFRDTYIKDKNYNLSSVWVLIGLNSDKKDKQILQVGKSKNCECMLINDINPDVHSIITSSGNKYGNLSYENLSFYQIDINAYLEKDNHIHHILKEICPEDENLKSAYYNIKASYVEGKIASSIKENATDTLWHKSPTGIDGDIYNYFKSNTKN